MNKGLPFTLKIKEPVELWEVLIIVATMVSKWKWGLHWKESDTDEDVFTAMRSALGRMCLMDGRLVQEVISTEDLQNALIDFRIQGIPDHLLKAVRVDP